MYKDVKLVVKKIFDKKVALDKLKCLDLTS